MDIERFRRVGSIFELARTLDEDERRSLLERECASDESLRAEVLELLDHADRMRMRDDATFLDRGRDLRAGFSAEGAADSESPAIPSEIPSQIGKYAIRDVIARGGMGAVFSAFDESIGRIVAIKVLPASRVDREAARRRFLEEGRIGGQLQHPAIVPVHELGEMEDGRPFLAMKLIEGKTLSELLRERPDPGHERARFVGYFARVCQAMAFAHARHVIHRDLKPQNVMIGAFGEVQVMDWGLALRRSDSPPDAAADAATRMESLTDSERSSGSGSSSPRLSRPGTVLGTPAYMSPEQAQGDFDGVGTASDVFGLGAILCEILTGKPPYDGRDSVEVIAAARLGELHGATSRLENCGGDAELVQIALRALNPDPGSRPADAGELARLIDDYRASLETRARSAETEAAAARARAAAERRARRMSTALAVLVIAGIITAGVTYSILDSRHEARVRDAERGARGRMANAERLLDEARAARRPGSPFPASAWETARQAVLTATDLLPAGADPQIALEVEELLRRVESESRTSRFLAHLDEIALDREHVDASNRSDESRSYADAFQEFFGTDFLELTVTEAASKIRETAIASDIAIALDRWVFILRQLDRSSRDAKTLTAIATSIETDPWRAELREAVSDPDDSRLEALANSESTSQQPAASILLLAQMLLIRGRFATASAVLFAAIDRFPSDFELRLNLIFASIGVGDRNSLGRAIQQAEAVRALRPDSALALAAIAEIVSTFDAPVALRFSRAALEIDPERPDGLRTHGEVLEKLGDFANADLMVERALTRVTPQDRAHGELLLVRGRLAVRLGDFDRAIEWYSRAAAELAYDVRIFSGVLPDRGIHTPLERAIGAHIDAMERTLAAIESPGEAPATDGRRAAAAWRLSAEFYAELRLYDRSLVAWENVERIAGRDRLLDARISDARTKLSDSFATYASIDAAFEQLEPELSAEDVEERFRGVLTSTDESAIARRAYARARVLERAGDTAAAVVEFRSILERDRSLPEPFVRLFRALSALHGESSARSMWTGISGGGLPSLPIRVPPGSPAIETPISVDPESAVIRIRSTPYFHLDPRTKVLATRWIIWEEGKDPRLEPLIDVVSAVHTSEYPLDALPLRSGTTYGSIVGHVAENGLPSRFSRSATFTVADELARVVPFDIGSHLSVDVIASPGDIDDDAFDDLNDFRLIVEGYDGSAAASDDVRGLPRSREIGVHRLADFDGPNAIRLPSADPRQIRIDVPRDGYASVRFLVSGANGDSVLPLTFVHADGSRTAAELPCEDWFNDVDDGSIPFDSPCQPVWNGMDRMGSRRFEKRDDAAIFEVSLPVTEKSELIAIELDAERARFEGARTRLHLFSATGLVRIRP
jgi:serine/threonine protein kinase